MQQYGFICSCKFCALPPSQLALSDARRRIIGAFERALKGYKPDDLRWLESTQAAFPKGYPDIRGEGQFFHTLDTPLSVSEKTTYNFLPGVWREVEGSGMEYGCVAYTQAGLLLLQQIDSLGDMIALHSVQVLKSWLEYATQKMDALRPIGGIDPKVSRDNLHLVISRPNVAVALKWVSNMLIGRCLTLYLGYN